MSVLTLEAKLERADPNTSWGFRMQGGKDFSSLLTILRVTPGSLAAKCGLQAGDIILKIGSVAADTLKHKDAQDKIITSGNRLDLLLQRIREKKISGGGTANKPVTEKFSSPSFTPSLQPNQATPNSQQNYNALPRPFTSASQQPQQQAANLQYGSGIDGVTQQAQNLSMGSGAPAAYQPLTQKYNEGDDQPNPAQHQSRSFKLLKGMMDTGQGQPQQPSPPWIRKSLADEEKPSEKDVDEHDRKIYFPSETYALVHEQDLSRDQKLGTVAPKSQQQQLQGSHSRTFKLLQQKLDGAPSQHQAPPPPPPPPPPAPAPPAPRPPPVQTAPAWKPTSPQPPVPKPATTQVQPPWVQQVPRPASESATRPSASGAVHGKKGDAVFNRESSTSRIPVCASCGTPIRGPFVMAMGKTWCPDHFVCANPSCGVKLIDIGFVEEGGRLYCEKDYEQHFAPHCSKCRAPIVGECVNALQQQWHPVCFLCEHCKQPIGGGSFHIEDGKPFCDKDWAAMYQTMCFGCQFPIEPGDRWVEAMDHSWHSGCFNCTTCQASLEGQPFYAKSGKPYCKRHAR